MTDEGLVVVEQTSTVTRENGSRVSMPRCFVFEVTNDVIVRASVYRNEA
jgi:hypothetical protein